MNCIALSFVGKLPEYIVDCVYQIRFFTCAMIYVITDDVSSIYIQRIISLGNIEIVNYIELAEYSDDLKTHYSKFKVIRGLKERKELFFRSFERFYLLYGLMDKRKLRNVLFMEIDNLIYDDPQNWIDKIDKDIAFMIDNVGRASTGICYVKTVDILQKMLDYFNKTYLHNQPINTFFNEMGAV